MKTQVNKKQINKPQVQFIPKPILDPPPDTFPKEPVSHIGKCYHSNKIFINGKAGWNCPDCGFFITIASVKHNPIPKEPHVAVEHVTKAKSIPKIDNINILELPRGMFNRSGKALLGSLGEEDKDKLEVFKGYLNDGFKIEGFAVSDNKYVFLFIK